MIWSPCGVIYLVILPSRGGEAVGDSSIEEAEGPSGNSNPAAKRTAIGLLFWSEDPPFQPERGCPGACIRRGRLESRSLLCEVALIPMGSD
jgi:hypothetical protein